MQWPETDLAVVLDLYRKCHAPDPQGASLLQVVDHCLSKDRVLFAVHRISPLDQARQPHSIQVAVTCAHTEGDLRKAARALEGAVQQVGSWRVAGWRRPAGNGGAAARSCSAAGCAQHVLTLGAPCRGH